MAEYTNLTTLDGLAVGDTITYNTTTAIDFKGATVKVELYGVAFSSYGGGYTVFNINTSLLPSTILSFNNDYTVSGVNVSRRNDLIYGDTNDLYYRIAVAGNAGSGVQTNGSGSPYIGKGGGLEGGKGYNNYNSNYFYVTGGSQTSGGTCNTKIGSNRLDIARNGSFGSGNTTRPSTGAFGGYGWYGGGAGCYRTSNSVSDYFTGGSGGSGFIIGTSTTTYPSGYLGDSEYLKSVIPSSITEGVLTQGGSTKTTPTMILTIVDPVDPNARSNFSYYNGTEFIKTTANYYNGTEFIPCNAFRYNGTEFIKLS